MRKTFYFEKWKVLLIAVEWSAGGKSLYLDSTCYIIAIHNFIQKTQKSALCPFLLNADFSLWKCPHKVNPLTSENKGKNSLQIWYLTQGVAPKWWISEVMAEMNTF